MLHRTAGPSHYDWEAASYDYFNEKNSRTVNRALAAIFRGRGVKLVLDLACGTGSQVFWLARRGFRVAGRDISEEMLAIARRKASTLKLAVDLRRGDMRTVRAGPVDGAITISNAIGHLTRPEFARAMRNIRENLAPGGVYVFDIYNLDWLKAGDHITGLTIDWIGREGRRRFRQVQYSTIDARGVLRSYTTTFSDTRTSNFAHTLQTYAAGESRAMLRSAGFKRVTHRAIDGSSFSRRGTDRMLTIAEA